jgi:hypothetical protein
MRKAMLSVALGVLLAAGPAFAADRVKTANGVVESRRRD